MEAYSIRILNSSNSIFLKFHPLLKSSPKSLLHQSPFPCSLHLHPHPQSIHTKPYCCTRIPSSFPHPSLSHSLGFPNSFSTSNPSPSPDQFARITSPSENKPFQWNVAVDGVNGENGGKAESDNEAIVTVVMLGWLGSKQKHLKRYAELYTARGIHAITFVAPVAQLLSVDLGRKFQRRIAVLATELVSWLSETEKDGRERLLLFHTFSNTGWLAYGAILNDLQGRPDLLERIKGCIFDSGGDPNIDPTVWAAGFAAALLKKHSSTAYPSVLARNENEIGNGKPALEMSQKQPLFVEIFFLSLLEKLFSFLLNLPDVKQRLTKIIHGLSENQPPCPQLYLYSTADKVIPFQSVESFIKDQTKMGRKILSFNFETSPHVDHYRTFPSMYKSHLENFFTECLANVKQM